MKGLHDIVDLNLQKLVATKSVVRTAIAGIITTGITILMPLIYNATKSGSSYDLQFASICTTLFAIFIAIFISYLSLKVTEYEAEHIKFLSVDYATKYIWTWSEDHVPTDEEIEHATYIIGNKLERSKALVRQGLETYYRGKENYWDLLWYLKDLFTFRKSRKSDNRAVEDGL